MALLLTLLAGVTAECAQDQTYRQEADGRRVEGGADGNGWKRRRERKKRRRGEGVQSTER